MMVVCIELRIPLFLVGKPGSSKSLAKTIVADAMQGNTAHTRIYRNYKQVHKHKHSYTCGKIYNDSSNFQQRARFLKDIYNDYINAVNR